jgi:Fic family protein
MKRSTGTYVVTSTAGEEVRAFVPSPLPPTPPLERAEPLNAALAEAERKLGALTVALDLLPNADLFAYSFVRKEAVFSSQIEGIQATLSDLLNYEAAPDDFETNQDVLEVCNYLDALQYGRKQMKDPKGLPLSLRLIRDVHWRLMRGVRGATKNPGAFRTTQNWIGGSRPGNAHFVPPPPSELRQCLNDFEKYLHRSDPKEHPLIRVGMIHVQFETIHPFLDGNGRLGRLLIALLLEAWLGLDARLLYLSLYFKRNQQEYYHQLDSIRSEGNWEGWTKFFLTGISEMAGEAVQTSRKIFQLFENNRRKLLKNPKALVPALRLHDFLSDHPVLTIGTVVKLLDTTKPTAAKAVDALIKAGILRETTGAKRNRIFGYKDYVQLLKGE